MTELEIIEKFNKYDKLIRYVMKKDIHIYEFSKLDIYEYEDFYSEGKIGLYQGIMNYSNDKNIKEITYYYICIKNKLLNFINNICSKSKLGIYKNVSLEVINKDYEVFGNEDELELIKFNNFIDDNINRNIMDFYEKNIVFDLCNGYLQKEIASKCNINDRSISIKLNRVRNIFAKNYLFLESHADIPIHFKIKRNSKKNQSNNPGIIYEL